MRPGGRGIAADEGEYSIGYVGWREPTGLVKGVVVGGSIVTIAARSRSGCRELRERDIFNCGGLCNWNHSRVMSFFVVV